MTTDTETTKKIRLFGLNTYEAKIWAALLSKGTSTAGELSGIANVPRSRSYDVLESLRKKGFVSAKTSKPIRYIAVPPKDALENIKTGITKTCEEHLYYINSKEFNELISNLQETHDKNARKNESVVAILKGRENIHKHLNFLLKNTKKFVISSIDRDQDAQPEATSGAKSKARTSTRAKDIGIRACIVGEDDSLLFPIQETQVHPDYDLCIWIKHGQTTKFLKEIMSFA